MEKSIHLNIQIKFLNSYLFRNDEYVAKEVYQ